MDSSNPTPSPLSRFKVLDLTVAGAGPAAVRQLSDWGADVIRIERVGEGDDIIGGRQSADMQNLHRNKRSLSLDLKTPAGLEILKALVVQADVLIENFRPPVKFSLGIDYESLRPLNPKLVYASISGFGQSGPYSNRPGLDQIAQGMGGLMSITGAPGQGPMRAGIRITDLAAGIFCAYGVILALLEREASGKGQYVESSLLASQIALLDFQGVRWLVEKDLPAQAGNDHPTAAPVGVYRTSDGHINIAAGGDTLFGRLCTALGAPHLATDPAYANNRNRFANRAQLSAAIDTFTQKKTSAQWVEELNAARIPCGPIYRIDEVFADPGVRHLGMTREVQHPALGAIELIGQPVTLSRTPWSIREAAPDPGQHTDEILRDLGYSDADIAALYDKGALGTGRQS